MSGDQVLRLGIVGLGRHWEKRYKPALHRLKSLFQIAAVADQVQHRASQEGKHLNCAVARGVAEMLRYPDMDALVLADPQWYGLWPVQMAAEFDKPVFCGWKAKGQIDSTWSICQQETLQNAKVMLEFPLRQSPLLAALREVCQTQLGPVHLLRCNRNVPPKRNPGREAKDFLEPDYLDFCLQFLQGEPRRLLASGLADGSLTGLFVELSDGRALQINWCVAGEQRSCRLELFAEGGTAVANFPNRISWRSKAGKWTRIIPVKKNPILETLREFHRMVLQKVSPSPNLQEGCRLWHWQRLILQSWKQGGWVESISP